jgi:hypothetical protein
MPAAAAGAWARTTHSRTIAAPRSVREAPRRMTRERAAKKTVSRLLTRLFSLAQLRVLDIVPRLLRGVHSTLEASPGGHPSARRGLYRTIRRRVLSGAPLVRSRPRAIHCPRRVGAVSVVRFRGRHWSDRGARCRRRHHFLRCST